MSRFALQSEVLAAVQKICPANIGLDLTCFKSDVLRNLVRSTDFNRNFGKFLQDSSQTGERSYSFSGNFYLNRVFTLSLAWATLL